MAILNVFTYLKKYDWFLLVPTLLLTIFGLASLYSGTLNVAEPNWIFFNKQLTFFIIGFGLLIFASIVDYRRWRSYSLIFYFIALIFLVAVLFWGTEIRGTTGWFYIFGFGLQPVELMKFAMVLTLAFVYSKRKDKEQSASTLLIVSMITLIPVFLAILQPDYGSAVIMLGIGVGFYALINMKPKHLIYILLLVVLSSILIWNFLLLDYHQDRILTFLDPMRDPLGEGYNVRQSIIAVGSGSLFGRGLGLGTQSQLQFLPEVQTDFIFAAIAETLGFFGVTLIIVFFSILLIRILLIMKEARDSFSMYVCYGFGLIFFMQMFVNIGMNLGMLPVAGLSLPFVSYGGSFLIISMIAIGIIESIRLRQRIL